MIVVQFRRASQLKIRQFLFHNCFCFNIRLILNSIKFKGKFVLFKDESYGIQQKQTFFSEIKLQFDNTHPLQTNKIKMANLDQQTPHFYMYQLRNPRVHNPTYNSNQVGNSCFSLYTGGPTNHSNLPPSSSRPELRQQLKRSRGNSQLSNFGSSLLQIKDTDIYNKQQSKIDLISMQPVWHQETIKKYPKYTLEDKDAYYYRRMAPKVDQVPVPATERATGSRYQNNTEEIAAKMNGGQNYKNYKDKLELDLWESYQGKKPTAPKFQAKMLNHADEFRSIM